MLQVFGLLVIRNFKHLELFLVVQVLLLKAVNSILQGPHSIGSRLALVGNIGEVLSLVSKN